MSLPAVVRLACANDVPAILRLERAVEEAPHWTEGAYRGYITPPAGTLLAKVLYVASVDDQIYGFIAGACLAGQGEIESLAVDQRARRSGLGSRLFDAVRRWAQEHGARTLMLEVRAGNQAAQAFYRSHGFAVHGLRQRYYHDPPEDALLMRCDLLEAEVAAGTHSNREL